MTQLVKSSVPLAPRLVAASSLLALLFGADTFAAEVSRFREPKPRVVEDLFRLEVSAFGAGFDTNLRVDDSSGTTPGTDFNIEDDLGLDDQRTLIEAEITFLPGERHLLRLSGTSTRRSETTTLNKTITIEDDTFVINDVVSSKLDLTLFGLTYGYRFLKRERYELVGTFAIQIAEVDTNITGGSTGRNEQDAEDGVAPVPLVGLEGRFDFGDRWSTEGRIQYVGANTQDVDGRTYDARIAVTWRQNPYLVYGVGYRRFIIDVDSDDDDNSGRVDYTMGGPLLFLRASL